MRRPHFLTLSTLLSLTSSAVALDEYLPIPPRKMEIDIGIQRSSVRGAYDLQGEFVESPDPDNPLTIPMQGKFGLMEGLDAEMELTYVMQDTTGEAGIDRPILALKYAHPVQGYGGFIAVTLPFGFEEIVSTEPQATIALGALYGQSFKNFRLLANGSFWFNTEDVTRRKQDYFSFFVKPEYSLNLPQLGKRYLGLYVAGEYDVYLEKLVDSKGTHEYGHLVTFSPGVYFKLNQYLAFETKVPFTVLGENQPSLYGAWARLFLTLDMEM